LNTQSRIRRHAPSSRLLDNVVVVVGEVFDAASSPLLYVHEVVHHPVLVRAAFPVGGKEGDFGTKVGLGEVVSHAKVVSKLVSKNLKDQAMLLH